jgi:hypothetical protein
MVKDHQPHNGEIEAIVAWFLDKDFSLLIEVENVGKAWAHLTRPPGGQVVAARYGGGTDPLAAARGAQHRFEEEQ